MQAFRNGNNPSILHWRVVCRLLHLAQHLLNGAIRSRRSAVSDARRYNCPAPVNTFSIASYSIHEEFTREVPKVRCHGCTETAVVPAGTDHLGIITRICPSCGKWYRTPGDSPSLGGNPSQTSFRLANELIPDEDQFADLPEGL